MKYKLIILLLVLFSDLQVHAQWTQLPNLPVSGTVYDMYFVNSNTGWISLLSPFSIIKTTDGGLSWTVQSNIHIRNIQFLDENTGYGNGYIGTTGTLWKTTDAGLSWNSTNMTGMPYGDLFFISKDTGWVTGYDGFFGKIYRTTNGGQSLDLQATLNVNGLDKIFFLKNKVNGEYWGWTFKGTILFKTTNSGVNWTQISNNFGCGSGYDMYFIDTSKGIITGLGSSCFTMTTDGGNNWIQIFEFNAVNSKIGIGDTSKFWLSLGASDTVIKTINYFQTYGKQHLPALAHDIFALDTSLVYGVWNMNNVVKTTNGGGPIIYLGIDTNNTIVPAEFILYQNYPNPFNPQTTVKFSLAKSSSVSLTIYDITGKEVIRIYDNEHLRQGNYKAVIDFDKLNISSGVYFYTLETEDFKESRKMIFIK